ncbi:MAG: Holliday junction branch migration protein RuvA [Alphaproteobacteria bacterium]
MIAKLKGIIDTVTDTFAVVDVQGVGYLVQASTRTLGKLTVGEAGSLHIETVVREDAISLFGFADLEEREWFKLLQSVQGVGARVALAILAIHAPAKLSMILAAQDKAAVSQANGVGPKLAGRIVSELKDKAINLPTGSQAQLDTPQAEAKSEAPSSANADAISALENLGYGRSEAYSAVAAANANLGSDADVSALISAALKALLK